LVKVPVEPGQVESVVVDITVTKVESVPYAKPQVVAAAPPVALIVAFRVATTALMLEAELVATVGAETPQVAV
jgi:hypothetical protein